MKSAFIKGVGLVAPGLESWEQAQPVLRGLVDYSIRELPKLTPELLPANERRRATLPIRIALEAARQATVATSLQSTRLRAVFASADGEMGIVDQMCKTLAKDPRQMSPTLFHNSVHNAAAGYWSIGVGSLAPSTSLSAGDGSFAAGLLEAWCQLADRDGQLLLVASDVPAPPPLAAHRPMLAPFGSALLLDSKSGPGTIAKIGVSLSREAGAATQLKEAPQLEALRLGNPAARALTMLAALARGSSGSIRLPLSTSQALQVDLTPLGI